MARGCVPRSMAHAGRHVVPRGLVAPHRRGIARTLTRPRQAFVHERNAHGCESRGRFTVGCPLDILRPHRRGVERAEGAHPQPAGTRRSGWPPDRTRARAPLRRRHGSAERPHSSAPGAPTVREGRARCASARRQNGSAEYPRPGQWAAPPRATTLGSRGRLRTGWPVCHSRAGARRPHQFIWGTRPSASSPGWWPPHVATRARVYLTVPAIALSDTHDPGPLTQGGSHFAQL